VDHHRPNIRDLAGGTPRRRPVGAIATVAMLLAARLLLARFPTTLPAGGDTVLRLPSWIVAASMLIGGAACRRGRDLALRADRLSADSDHRKADEGPVRGTSR